MLFTREFHAGITEGSVTLTFRRWRRRQAVAGNRYRTSAGIIHVDRIDVVEPGDVTDADAHRAGYTDATRLLADLRGTSDLLLYRIAFHLVDGPDPREVLAADDRLTESDVVEIDGRLDRLDRGSRHGPWTASVLAAIRDHPEARAAELAAGLGRDTPSFKLDVRKLKNLGLTTSLEVGYRLSPRGRAYLAQTTRPVP